MNEKFRKFDPAVDKKFLVALSGVMWSAVGIMLCNLAAEWLARTSAHSRIWPGAAGLVMSLVTYRFGFLKLVDRNIERILAKKGKVCIFGFQPWKSYFMIAVMISMGTALRHSPLPKHYLAIIYIGMGGAMLLSSIRYYRTFLKLITVKSRT